MRSLAIRSLTLRNDITLSESLSAITENTLPTVKQQANRVIGSADGRTFLTLYEDGSLYVTGTSFGNLRNNIAMVSDRLLTDRIIEEPIECGHIVTGQLDFGEYIDKRVLQRAASIKISSTELGTMIRFAGEAVVELRFVGVRGLATIDMDAPVDIAEKTLEQFDSVYRAA